MYRFAVLLFCTVIVAAGSLLAAPVPFPRDRRFPDGVSYDFGKVLRGTQVKHTFRVVNTSSVPLQVVSLRIG